ncbi:MAG: MraY family glycosyltransferase [Coriobacteriia bacterium]|nr:MraY family glycosyltransferase [Coriobacteriia bacterium]
MSAGHYALLLAVAAAVTLATTPLVRRFGISIGAVATPGGRNVHEGLIPRIGGLAIFIGVFAALGVQWLGEARFGWDSHLLQGGGSVRTLGVIAGLTLMFAVGFIDDFVSLKPGAKLLGQIMAASVVVWAGLRIAYVGNPVSGGLIMLGILSVPVTVLYLIGFANVINLIDGLDGLAAGVTAIAATSLLILAIQGNRLDAAVLAAAVIGACIGFLRYNFHPASIFMGDSGAMFLGFTLAVISLLGVMKTTATIALAVPLLIIGVPIFDTSSAIIRRITHKRPIAEADRGHIHHRLLGRGFDQRQTVIIIYIWSAALAVAAYAVRYSPGSLRVITLLALFSVTAFMAHWLGLFEAAHHHDDPKDS